MRWLYLTKFKKTHTYRQKKNKEELDRDREEKFEISVLMRQILIQ